MAGEGGDGSWGMRELAADPKAEHSGLEGPVVGLPRFHSVTGVTMALLNDLSCSGPLKPR